MPRKVRDSNLETRTARSKLKVRHKPYFRLIEPGLHLAYRKLGNGPGTWIVRRYCGEGSYKVENLRTADGAIVLADDYADADGKHVLNFAQAQQQARGAIKARSGPLTVGDAIDNYLQHLDAQGRSPQSLATTRHSFEAHIRPSLGTAKVSALTTERLRNWRDAIAKTPARMRTAAGEAQRFRDLPDDDDSRRARRATVNRIWNNLRAALNHAFRDGKAETDIAWRRVKPFADADAARTRYLTVAEAKRLINACDPEFRPLVQAALNTGARYSELARLQVQDFNVDAGTVAVRKSKSGKPRHIVLTDEGMALFRELTAGRAGDDLILHRATGAAWGVSHQAAFMRSAVKRAKISPSIGFHGLRHSWASLSVMAGMPLMVVARNLGHVDSKMVEAHYGHLAPSYVADSIRKHAPRFGFVPDSKVASIR
jgi:integrase